MDEERRRILIVEDDSFSATLIESLLTAQGFVVRVCTDASSARAAAEELDPDLALLDVNLGSGPTGVQLGFVLEKSHPAMAIAYLTRYPTALARDYPHSDLLDGKMILSKDDVTDAKVLVDAVEKALTGRSQPAEDIGDSQISRLTPTQMQVLRLLTIGMTNAAIAKHRSTSERAVEKQVKAIYTALGLEADQRTNARVLAARRYTEAMGEPTLDESVDLLGLGVADEQSA